LVSEADIERTFRGIAVSRDQKLELAWKSSSGIIASNMRSQPKRASIGLIQICCPCHFLTLMP
ncbi:MAG: hypothetical protein ABI901_05815, partial [Roseiflexaceae bacterium]